MLRKRWKRRNSSAKALTSESKKDHTIHIPSPESNGIASIDSHCGSADNPIATVPSSEMRSKSMPEKRKHDEEMPILIEMPRCNIERAPNPYPLLQTHYENSTEKYQQKYRKAVHPYITARNSGNSGNISTARENQSATTSSQKQPMTNNVVDLEKMHVFDSNVEIVGYATLDVITKEVADDTGFKECKKELPEGNESNGDRSGNGTEGFNSSVREKMPLYKFNQKNAQIKLNLNLREKGGKGFDFLNTKGLPWDQPITTPIPTVSEVDDENEVQVVDVELDTAQSLNTGSVKDPDTLKMAETTTDINNKSEMDGKESEMNEKESEMNKKESEMNEKESEMEGKESETDGKESEMNEKESEVEGKESETDGKESEMNEKESENVCENSSLTVTASLTSSDVTINPLSLSPNEDSDDDDEVQFLEEITVTPTHVIVDVEERYPPMNGVCLVKISQKRLPITSMSFGNSYSEAKIQCDLFESSMKFKEEVDDSRDYRTIQYIIDKLPTYYYSPPDANGKQCDDNSVKVISHSSACSDETRDSKNYSESGIISNHNDLQSMEYVLQPDTNNQTLGNDSCLDSSLQKTSSNSTTSVQRSVTLPDDISDCMTTESNKSVLPISKSADHNVEDRGSAPATTERTIPKDKDTQRLSRSFTCRKCPSNFPTLRELSVHFLCHCVCFQCNIDFETRDRIMRHLRDHHGVDTYYCRDCGQTFGNRTRLRQHNLYHHQASTAIRKLNMNHRQPEPTISFSLANLDYNQDNTTRLVQQNSENHQPGPSTSCTTTGLDRHQEHTSHLVQQNFDHHQPEPSGSLIDLNPDHHDMRFTRLMLNSFDCRHPSSGFVADPHKCQYACTCCDRMYMTRGRFMLHLRTHCVVLNKCAVCHDEFEQALSYNKSRFSVNIMCHQCTKNHLNQSVKYHGYLRMMQMRYSCMICNSSDTVTVFKSLLELEKHQVIHVRAANAKMKDIIRNYS